MALFLAAHPVPSGIHSESAKEHLNIKTTRNIITSPAPLPQKHTKVHSNKTGAAEYFVESHNVTTEDIESNNQDHVPSYIPAKSQMHRGSEVNTEGSIANNVSFAGQGKDSELSNYVKVYSYVLVARRPGHVNMPSIIGHSRKSSNYTEPRKISIEENTPWKGVELIFVWAMILLVCAVCMLATLEKEKKEKPPPYSELVNQQEEMDI